MGFETADAGIAYTINIKQATPVLCIEILAYTYKEKPYEYRKSYCLTDLKKVFREW